MRLDMLKPYSTALLLSLWLFSYAFFFVVLPDELRWLYILLFPFLIGNEVWQAWREKRLKLSINPFEWLILAYIIYVGISLYGSNDLPLPKEIYGVEFLFRIVQPMLLFVYLRLKPLDKPQLLFFSYALLILVVIQLLLGFVSLIIPESLPLAYQPRAAHLYTRATGTMVSPEAYVLTQLFAFVLFLYQSLQNTVNRKYFYFGMFAAAIGIIISGNRTGWIDFAFLLMFSMLINRQLIKWIFAFGVAGLLLVMLLFPSYFQKAVFRLQEWRQIESRITMHSAGLRMALEKPLLGWGYATYDLFDWQHMQTEGEFAATNYELAIATSHNSYLTIWAETGIIGLLLYLSTTFYYFIRSIFIWRRIPDKVYLASLWMIIFMVHFAAQAADLRFFPFVLGFWWFALAMIANELETNHAPA